MKQIRIARNWLGIDLLRQTPGNRGIWEDVSFTLDDLDSCDYLLISNAIPHDIRVSCPPEHIWTLVGEPPIPGFRQLHDAPGYAHRVLTTDDSLIGERYIHTQTALPWWVNRDYDDLVSCGIPVKTRDLSWITSNRRVLDGHNTRMNFLERIRGKIRFDLFGNGFEPIDDKWDALAPYRYSLAIENFSNPYYWTEKIADCFLTWTMPIYYGCTRINRYFPEEAMIRIDIHNPDVDEQIKEAVMSNRWRQGLDAIEYSRRLVLDKYQMFPLIVNEINRFESATGCCPGKRDLTLRKEDDLMPLAMKKEK